MISPVTVSDISLSHPKKSYPSLVGFSPNDGVSEPIATSLKITLANASPPHPSEYVTSAAFPCVLKVVSVVTSDTRFSYLNAISVLPVSGFISHITYSIFSKLSFVSVSISSIAAVLLNIIKLGLSVFEL